MYRYGQNNPLAFADLDGHCDKGVWQCLMDMGSGLIGAVHNAFVPINQLGSAIFDPGGPGCGGDAQCAETGKGSSNFGPTTAFVPTNQEQARGVLLGNVLLTAVPAVAPEISVTGAVVDMTPTLRAPSMIGFSESETGMINQSLSNLSGIGYDLSPIQQLVKADLPPGYCAMCLSSEPTGMALGDGAFQSQGFLDHTLEEELLHLNQNLRNETFGPGTAAAKEAEVDAARKIPDPTNCD